MLSFNFRSYYFLLALARLTCWMVTACFSILEWYGTDIKILSPHFVSFATGIAWWRMVLLHWLQYDSCFLAWVTIWAKAAPIHACWYHEEDVWGKDVNKDNDVRWRLLSGKTSPADAKLLLSEAVTIFHVSVKWSLDIINQYVKHTAMIFPVEFWWLTDYSCYV